MITLSVSKSSKHCRFLANLIITKIIRHKMDNAIIIKGIQDSIPALDGSRHKGQAGRIGIIGGSLEYTGAPYFAGISALKVGADLVHMFCMASAASVIKSYSPELIVHPLLDHPNGVAEIKPWLDRLHVLVIGPGLGRDIETFKVVSEIIHIAREKCIGLVIDADGLFLITNDLDLIKDYPSPGVILTPNKIEFERFYTKVKVESAFTEISIDYSKLGKNIMILKKGETDEFFSSNALLHWKSAVGGTGRRCGGQGDILSGSIATFFHWSYNHICNDVALKNDTDKCILAASLACYAAARLVRVCNQKAFEVKHRSMLASDMIEQIPDAFKMLYES